MIAPALSVARDRGSDGEPLARPLWPDAEPDGRLERMSVVIGGHVDHGKSTIVGRLLADTCSLPEGKLEQVRALCERTARPFEYAFLLDALKDEQAQGITIDTARVFFRTPKRHYIVLDAPGHIELLKNMVTGAARAEAGLLVIDAHEGVQENSRRHGYMMSMLGVRQTSVLVNKMDLVGYDEAAFTRIVREYSQFLRQIDVEPAYFVPVAGRDGDNVARRSTAMPWYVGPTVLEALDAFESERSPVEKPFRMPVQDVYKFTSQGDSRRIVAGTVETGVLRVGDEVVFYPSGKKSRVKSIEAFNAPPRGDASAGEATGFTLTEQVYVARGEVAALSSEPRPHVTTRLRVNLFWLGSTPLVPLKDYVLKLGTARAIARVEEIVRVIDASSLAATERRDQVGRHDVAECVLKLNRAVGFDLAHEIPPTGRFVLVDDFEIRGGGTVREALPDWQARGRDEGLSDDAWEPSGISPERRAEKYGQRATLVLVTGPGEAARNALARGLEARLFDDGTVVYCLGVENVRCAAGADVDLREPDRAERVRRLADVANLVLDTGVILIVTVAELTQGELELIKTRVDAPRVQTIWVGDTATTDVVYDVTLTAEAAERDGVERLHVLLEDLGAVCRGR